MFFSTDYDLSYVYLQDKSEKAHGLFGLGWKNQEHTVICILGSTLFGGTIAWFALTHKNCLGTGSGVLRSVLLNPQINLKDYKP